MAPLPYLTARYRNKPYHITAKHNLPHRNKLINEMWRGTLRPPLPHQTIPLHTRAAWPDHN